MSAVRFALIVCCSVTVLHLFSASFYGVFDGHAGGILVIDGPSFHDAMFYSSHLARAAAFVAEHLLNVRDFALLRCVVDH